MIVQYLIDWHYIRQRINAECSDSFRLDILRKDLRRLRKNILVNGVVLTNETNELTRELQDAIRYSDQGGSGGLKPEWVRLARELVNFQQLYKKRSIRLKRDGSYNLNEVLDGRCEYLRQSNLHEFDLPCAIISDFKGSIEHGVERLRLEDYEESDTEKKRSLWESVSYSPDSIQSENDRRQYFAGMSLAASCYGQVTFYDPYCLCVLFESGTQTGLLRDWKASIFEFMSYFVRNQRVKKIKFVGKDDITGKAAHLSVIEEKICELMDLVKCRRRNSIRVSFSAKGKNKNKDWHNRYIDLGVCVCSLPNGLDVFRATGAGCEVYKHFVIKIEKDCVAKSDEDCKQLDYAHVRSLASGASYRDAVGLARKGIFSCDIDLQGCAPEAGCDDEFLSIEIFPKIRIVHR